MTYTETISDGVTVTWAGPPRAATRRRRRRHALRVVTTRIEPRRTQPTADDMALVSDAVRRNAMAAALQGTLAYPTAIAMTAFRSLTSDTLSTRVAVLCLHETGWSDPELVAAIWTGSASDEQRRTAMCVLLRDASWSVGRLLSAAADVGIGRRTCLELLER